MATIRQLEIDIECYSSADLTKCGVYRYVEAPDFEILLFGYSADGGKVQVIDLTQGEADARQRAIAAIAAAKAPVEDMLASLEGFHVQGLRTTGSRMLPRSVRGGENGSARIGD